MSPIPFDEAQITEWLSRAFEGFMIIWIWWKDSPMTNEAITSHLDMVGEKLMKKLSDEARDEFSAQEGSDNECI